MPVSAERVRARASTLGSSAAHAAGHVVGHLVEPARVDQRRRPAHREGRAGAALGAAAPLALAQQRDHRPVGGQLDRPDRDVRPTSGRSAPRRRRPGRRPPRPASRGRRRRARRARRPGHPPASGSGRAAIHPAVGAPASSSIFATSSLAGHGRAGTSAPRHDASGSPRDLELRHPGLGRASSAESFTAVGTLVVLAAVVVEDDAPFDRVEPIPCRRQAPVVELRVRQHLVAFVAGDRSDRGDVLLGLTHEAEERGAPPGSVRLEDRELLGGGLAVGFRLDVQVELPGSERGGRRRLDHQPRTRQLTTRHAGAVRRPRSRSHVERNIVSTRGAFSRRTPSCPRRSTVRSVGRW